MVLLNCIVLVREVFLIFLTERVCVPVIMARPLENGVRETC